MNLFLLDSDHAKCARAHNKAHLNKMLTETVQMLCWAMYASGRIWAPMSNTKRHWNHPWTRWVRESKQNYAYARRHALHLHYHWVEVRGCTHGAGEKIEYLEYPGNINLPDIGLTEFPRCFSGWDLSGVEDIYQAYRAYYILDKQHLASWYTQPPSWWMSRREFINLLEVTSELQSS